MRKLYTSSEAGVKQWRTKFENAEREKDRLESLAASTTVASSSRPRTRSQDKDLECSACPGKDQEITALTATLTSIEATNVHILSQKSALDASHLYLSNRHTALERSSARQLDDSNVLLSNLKEEMEDLRLNHSELEREMSGKVEAGQLQLRIMATEKEQIGAEVTESKHREHTLQDKLQASDLANEELKAELAVSMARKWQSQTQY